MHILLVNAPHTEDGERVRRFSRPWPPLDLLNCAGVLRHGGHSVDLLDYRASVVPDAARDRAAARADRIVITTTPLDRWQCPTLNTEALFRFIRAFPAGKTWVSGAHATMRPEWMLDRCGTAGLIVGEPESAMAALTADRPAAPGPGLAVRVDGRIVVERAPPVEMTTLPMPAFDLLDMRRYHYQLLGSRFLVFETARGCPFGCTFCSREMYGKRVRRKTTAQVVEEVARARTDIGFQHAYFIDLEFTFHREPVVELCEAILSHGWQFGWTCQTRFDQIDEALVRLMKRAGCRLIHFGVETGADRHVKALRKGLTLARIREQHALVQRCGIETALFFLIGHPDETEAEQHQTVAFARDLSPDYASFHIASPYPGTPFHDQLGPLEDPFPAFDDRSHSIANLERMRRQALRQFYLRPGYVASRLHPARLGRAIRGVGLLRQLMG